MGNISEKSASKGLPIPKKNVSSRELYSRKTDYVFTIDIRFNTVNRNQS